MDARQAANRKTPEITKKAVIVLDANVIVSAILGKHTRTVLKAAAKRGLRLGAASHQIEEAARVLIEKLSMPVADARELLDELMRGIELIPDTAFAAFEGAARERLHARAQSDWPILAAALAYDSGIWSHDHNFFGVGTPVWSSRNMKFARG